MRRDFRAGRRMQRAQPGMGVAQHRLGREPRAGERDQIGVEGEPERRVVPGVEPLQLVPEPEQAQRAVRLALAGIFAGELAQRCLERRQVGIDEVVGREAVPQGEAVPVEGRGQRAEPVGIRNHRCHAG